MGSDESEHKANARPPHSTSPRTHKVRGRVGVVVAVARQSPALAGIFIEYSASPPRSAEREGAAHVCLKSCVAVMNVAACRGRAEKSASPDDAAPQLRPPTSTRRHPRLSRFCHLLTMFARRPHLSSQAARQELTSLFMIPVVFAQPKRRRSCKTVKITLQVRKVALCCYCVGENLKAVNNSCV